MGIQTINLGEVDRLTARLAVDLAADALEFQDEAKALAEHLRNDGFHPELRRAKAYRNGSSVIGVIPFYAEDTSQFAAISIRKELERTQDDAPASATIVELAQETTPVRFTLVTVEKGRVKRHGPVDADELRRRGAREIFNEIGPGGGPALLERFTHGRGLAPVVLSDYVSEELFSGFLSEAEYVKILGDAELSADVARLHAYVNQATGGGLQCSHCCSCSCICTSTSCFVLPTLTAN